MNQAIRDRFYSQGNKKHALWIHDVAIAEIEKLNQVYKPPVEMQEKWDESHKHCVEKSAWIKTTLAM